ncbi:hypothetical protein K490DRAFT_16916, partial [Saccharata proteae CBS 121410]
SPTTAAATSQKRPLEEPSSPSGPGDQPDAKRPALDKVVKEASAEEEEHANESTGQTAIEVVPSETAKADEEAPARQNGVSKDGQGDTVVPDAPTLTASQIIDTQPIQSTSANGRAESQGAMGHQDETGWLHVRAIISSAEAATVIGKGGENVTMIRRMSGAKCTVSDYSRGAVERILTVSGLVDAVAKAFGLIIRTLNNEALEAASTPQSKTYPLRLLIPHILIGSIIGKSGVRIREIQEASGARLNASDSCLPLSTERSLVVLGVADAVHIATYYVGSTLVEQLTERFGGPAASAYATRSGGPAGVVPGGMQVVPYSPQPAGGQWGGPDTYRKQNPRGPPVANPYGGPMHGQYQQQSAQAPLHYAAGSPRQGGYTGAGPHQPQPYGAPHVAPQAAHAGQAVAPMPGMAPGQPVTQQIYIPNDMVGAIIGKGGAKINEIRQLSGSVIKINEPQDSSNERLVTITGTQECNQMALYMLYTRLGHACKRTADSRQRQRCLAMAIHATNRHWSAICSTTRTYLDIPMLGFDDTDATSILTIYLSLIGKARPTPLCLNQVHRSGTSRLDQTFTSFHHLLNFCTNFTDGPRAFLTNDKPPAGGNYRTQFRNFTTISTVVVGPSETQFLIHRELLSHHSPFFAAALNGTFAEGLSQNIKLPAEDVATFELFIHWAYTGNLDDAFQRGGKVAFYLLLNLYGLADRLEVEKLRNQTVDKVAELAEKSNSVPTPSDTHTLYEDIRDTALMRNLVVDLFAFKKTDMLLASHPDEWHPTFLRELVVRVKRPEAQAMTRHALQPWKAASLTSTRACWVCRDV